jgi:hypothetical protein
LPSRSQKGTPTWGEIYEYVEERLAQQGPTLVLAKVTRIEHGRMLVWCEEEFADEPILWCGDYYRVFYFDHTPKDTTGFAMTAPPGNPYVERKAESEWGNSKHKGGYGGSKAEGKAQGAGIIPELPEPGATIIVMRRYGRKDKGLYGLGQVIGYLYI